MGSPISSNEKDKNKEKNKTMPLKDTLFLSPIEKYKFYGRFPWKMIIHLLLVILSTTQVNIFENLINIQYNDR
jgi:hypothetical protein